ncbi:plasmid recombination protein [uncultured Tateyamaria sp.]|uniref:plasmid recombination protein n=1 Tax=uncultured Tateyamaria sp. TaxID=455651 RepID=UPI00261CC59D|nr:plasmid recombination protein [uncultured Tateyamaria sp.]
MSGPQFLHLQSYSRKPNKIGQSVQQVLDEAAREPEFSIHVESPMPPKIIYGLTPQEVREKHDEIIDAGYVEATLKDGTVARRGIRKDRHTLLTAVASYPLLTAQVADNAAARDEYERWVELNVRWLKDTFGDRLVSVIEHMDEEHPHIHAFILPLGDTSCSARHLNPAWQVKEEAEALARESNKPAKEAVKLGNLAYRARGRELQDQYFEEVGLPAGLTRVGPKRERLSREQWKQRKEQARRDAALHRQMLARVETLVDAEAQLDVEADKKAVEVADKLARVEALYEEALSAKSDAEADACLILDRAKAESAQIKQRALTKLDEESQKLDRESSDLQAARTAFEHEKRTIVRETVSRVASVTARVLLGVLMGKVRLDEKRSELQFDDLKLAQDVERFEIAPIIQKAVVLVSKVWTKLTSARSTSEAESERKHVSEALKPIARPQSGGIEP